MLKRHFCVFAAACSITRKFKTKEKNMEDDDLAPSQFKVEVDTAEETESVEECRTIIPGRRS